MFHSKSDFYGAFVWVRRSLNSQKRRFAARAVATTGSLGAGLLPIDGAMHAASVIAQVMCTTS
jgi:hypothetical protein